MAKKATTPTAAIVLAAGKGTRMQSRLPKMLHPCGERPLVVRVVATALASGFAPVVVVIDSQGARVRETVRAHFPDAPIRFAVQEEQRGTGDAARAGLTELDGHRGLVAILYGDTPLLRASTLTDLERAAGKAKLAMLVAALEDPTGYGRVVRIGGRVTRIVEDRDASRAEKEIREINVGVYCTDVELLRRAVGGLSADNAQGELYLTDVVALAAEGGSVSAITVTDLDEVRGINTRAELAAAEAVYRRSVVGLWQAKGVQFRHPDSVILGEGAKLAQDVIIGAGVQLYGEVRIGSGARIEGPTVIKNATIGADTVVESFSHVEDAKIAKGATVGPYARIRPGSELEAGAKVGNFVELKKTKLGKGAKANHLAYLGDTVVGADANIGAGTITCNYDGFNKHKTEIGKGVFVGSNSTLVAPISLGPDAYVGAGSTLTEDAPKDSLALGRARQTNLAGYARKIRDRLKKS